MPMPYIRTAMTWCVILLCAMANGFLREAILAPTVGTTAAFVISGLILASCVVVVTLLSASFLGLEDPASGLRVGMSWLAMTVVFEFVFGLVLRGQTLREVLAPYTFEDGNLWPVVLLTLIVAPWWIGRSTAIRTGVIRRQSHDPYVWS